MKRKEMTSVIVALSLMIVLIGSVSAMSDYQTGVFNNITDLIPKIQYGIDHGFFVFSSWGQSNGCSVNPDWEGVVSQGNSVSCSKVSATKCAIDSWLERWSASAGPIEPLWNSYLGEIGGNSVSFTCSYPYCYSQIYSCPTTAPPTSNHSTTAYQCSNGNWNNVGTYGTNDVCSSAGTLNGNKCYCSSTNNNFYIDQSGGVHCQPSSYSSVTDGTWCPTPAGNTNTQTSTNGTGTSGVGVGDIRLNGKINPPVNPLNYFPSEPKSPVTFHIPLKNFGSVTETINVEAGFYSPNYARDIAKLISGSIFSFSVVTATPNCNPAENFVGTQQVTLNPGEAKTIEINVFPYYGFTTYSIGSHNLETEPLIWFAGIYKQCLGGYINDAGTIGKGTMFDYGNFEPTTCQFTLINAAGGSSDINCGGTKMGTCDGTSTLTITNNCYITSTTDVVLNKTTATQKTIITPVDVKGSFLDPYLSWAAFFDVNGDGVKDGIDGVIIIVGAILIFFIISAIGRKK